MLPARKLALLLAGWLMLSSGQLVAQSTTWTGQVSNGWSDPGNWTNGVPDQGKDAVINAPTGSFTPSTAGTANATCRALLLNNTGTLHIDPTGPLTVHQNCSLGGTRTGAGLLRLVGTGNASTSGSCTFLDVELSGTYTMWGTVAGNLTQTSAAGVITLPNTQNTGHLTVNGNAVLQGQGITSVSPATGLLDVRGNLTLQFQQATDLANGPALFRLGGNLTATATFRNDLANIQFDGSPTQTATLGTAEFRWRTVTINSGSRVSTPLDVVTSGDLVIQGRLDCGGARVDTGGQLLVNGHLDAPTATLVHHLGPLSIGGAGILNAPAALLDADGSVSLSGRLTLGPGRTHTFASTLASGGTLQVGAGSRIQLHGTGQASTGGAPSWFPDTELTGTYTMWGTVAGNLTQTSAAGLLTLPNTQSTGQLIVNGNAMLQGQGITSVGPTTGLLDVRGDLTMQFRQATNLTNGPALFRLGGNLTATATFRNDLANIEFNGAPIQTATVGTPDFVWRNLTVAAGARVSTPQDVITTGDLTVLGRLDCSSALIDVGGQMVVHGHVDAPSVALVHIAGGFTLGGAGILSAPSALLDVDGNASLSGALTLGPGRTHTFAGNLSSGGTLQAGAGSRIQLHGTGQASTGGTPSWLPDTELTGTYTMWGTIAGSLLQPSSGGLLTLPNSQSTGALTVNGSATFLGQGFTSLSPTTGILDVRGNLTLTTTQPVTQANGPAIIRCGGNWTSDASYQPSAGSVEFTGTGTQTVTAAALNLRIASVGNASNVVMQVQSLTVQQDLTVNGTFHTPPVALVVQRDLIVGGTGVVDASQGDNRINRNLTVQGSTTGTGTLILDGNGTVSGSGTIGRLRIDTIGGTITATNATVAGGLELRRGTLDVPNGSTLRLNGSNSMTGGTLSGNGTLIITGPVLWDGTTTASPMPAIQCANDWTAAPSFVPNRPVLFNPPTTATIRPTQPGGLVQFTDMQIQGGGLRLGSNGALGAATIAIGNGSLFDFGPHLATFAPVQITCDGELRQLAGGTMRLGHGSRIAVGTTGTLAQFGQAGNRCRITGNLGGTWRLEVRGTLHCNEFELRDLDGYRSPTDRGGVRLLPGTFLGPVPYDFSNGVLAGNAGFPANGSAALLSLENDTSRNFHDLDFVNTGAAPFRNVITTFGPTRIYRFYNYDGNLGGAAFEEDPNGIVDWISQGRTELASLSARPGMYRIGLAFQTSREVDTTRFRVFRSTTQGGPLTSIFSPGITATGNTTTGAAYAATDSPLTGTQRYWYQIYDERPSRPLRLLGEISARAWQPQIGDALFVGPGGFADIAAAVTAASPGNRIVVAAGTYPAFVLNKPVRIMADGSGPILIDTTLGPLQIRDMPANPDVAVYGLQVGAGSGPFGLEVVNCDNVVVLDQVTVTVAATATALRIDDCPQVALQAVTAQGMDGIVVTNQSVVYQNRGTLSTLRVQNGSGATHAGVQVTGASTRDASSTLRAVPGTSPRLDGPLVWPGLVPQDLTIASDPGDFYGLQMATTRAFVDLSALLPAEMVALVPPSASFTVGSGFVGLSGTVTIPTMAPDLAAGWGASVSIQVLVLRPAAARPFLLGNVRDVVFVP